MAMPATPANRAAQQAALTALPADALARRNHA